jgi:transcriptional regulator with XRE-family HTH domain
MDTIVSVSLDERLAERVSLERETRGWSVADLAARSGVSRAMISKIERGEVKPTASLLGRLSAALRLPLSVLLARIEDEPSRVSRGETQSWWTDPATRYKRRAISPPSDRFLQLTEVQLPPAARVVFPAAAFAFMHQQIWVLDGRLTFHEGAETHTLEAGDCLALGQPVDCVFENTARKTCRYVVAVVPR